MIDMGVHKITMVTKLGILIYRYLSMVIHLLICDSEFHGNDIWIIVHNISRLMDNYPWNHIITNNYQWNMDNCQWTIDMILMDHYP